MTPDARFARSERQVLVYEGGWVNSPKDPGGPTNQGVTLGALSEYLGRPASVTELRLMPRELRDAIYRRKYWSAVAGDALPAGVDLMCFDGAVNCGRDRAARWLQHALGVGVDGKVGAGTLHALEHASLGLVLEDMRQAREAHYRALHTFPTFGRGWLSRLQHVAALAHAWLEPVRPAELASIAPFTPPASNAMPADLLRGWAAGVDDLRAGATA